MFDDLLRSVPDVDVPVTPAITAGIAHSVHYLESDDAARSFEIDAYWPKWHSPWWHMTALWECGEVHRVSARTFDRMAAAIDRIKLHTFPTTPAEMDPLPGHTEIACHCAVGTMDQVLGDKRRPWFASWMRDYQMRDGGYNCDERAYLVTDEVPSSINGTIGIFESLLAHPEPALDRAGEMLLERELRLGSPTKHNADERTLEKHWLKPAFPRFYFYDVLRGLSAISKWKHALPPAQIEVVVEHLVRAFPDGVVSVQRRPYDAHGSWNFVDGAWQRSRVATSFPLLDALSIVGTPSHYLTAQWRATRERLLQR
ncbi:MAG: hypothetical protein QM831_20940 [Kofleriaceae bacterium]